MITGNGEEYTTRNVALAGTLIVKGNPMKRIQYDGEDKPHFKFDNTDEVHEIASSFYDGKMLVEPKEFSIQLRDLKKQVYDGRSNHGARS